MPHDQRPPGAVAESERRLRLLDDIARETRALSEPDDIMQATARLLGRHLGVNRCAYAEVGPDEDHFDLTGDYNDGVASIVGHYAFSDFGPEVTRLMRADKPYVNHDVETDPVTAGTNLAAYRLTQIQAVICVPLHKDGRFVAAMAVHQKTPRRWAEEDIGLVQMVVARCWESLNRARADKALREAHQRLSLAMSAGELGDWSWSAATNSHVEISISDTGVGMQPEVLPYIFDRFRQGDGSITRRFGGLGLGLSIVKHLVELHGGGVRAKSPGEGQGATFVVQLPVKAVHAGDAGDRVHPTDTAPVRVAFNPDELRGVKVLVVDDEPDSHELLRRIRGLGAANGGSLPAVALTAFARSEDRIRALRAGFAVHVSKPVEPSEIVATVANVAGRTERMPAA